ncbi:hypothetical protein KY285_006070 [Solanum tuberosum]|nr:hypothetical protein KY289_006566 [Solanum tuberosum]KAH0752922.1 hypothetical protein KY285_006070 [Solanum tuberosum]
MVSSMLILNYGRFIGKQPCPIGVEHRAPIELDVLPSGHRVTPNMKILISIYTMGRMESIWGNDCLEFKPERWITERGGVKHEPSHKFPVFHSGPRTCLGKDMTFIQAKMVAAIMIYNYNIQLMETQTISPTTAVVIRMTNGLKVKLSKRVL